MLENVKYCFRRYAGFSGRARRTEYVHFSVFNLVVELGLLALGLLFADFDSENPLLISAILMLIYSLATLLPSIAVTVRRLHDTGKSGAYYLLHIVPVVLFIISSIAYASSADSISSSYYYGSYSRDVGGAIFRIK